jgi:hypothetical protein
MNQVLYTRLLIYTDDLSKVVFASLVQSLHVTILLLPVLGTVYLVTGGISTILNHFFAGSIIVRRKKSILVQSLN